MPLTLRMPPASDASITKVVPVSLRSRLRCSAHVPEGRQKKSLDIKLRDPHQNAYKHVEKSSNFQHFTLMTTVRNHANLHVKCLRVYHKNLMIVETNTREL